MYPVNGDTNTFPYMVEPMPLLQRFTTLVSMDDAAVPRTTIALQLWLEEHHNSVEEFLAYPGPTTKLAACAMEVL
jgi:hypothetical protein